MPNSAPGSLAFGEAPTPLKLYIHDDITEPIRSGYGPASEPVRLAQELFDLVRQDISGVTVLTLEDQLGRLVGTGPHRTFAVTFGIGVAGEKVAQEVNRRTGWFPSVRRVDVAREEDGSGGYALVTAAGPLESQSAGLDGYESIAVVDDTVFSGLMMRAVLNAMPASSLANTQAFCLSPNPPREGVGLAS